MKKTLALALPILILGISSAGAQTISGTKLNIGSQGSGAHVITGNQAGAVGDYATVSGGNSFSVGAGNTVSGQNSLAVGYWVKTYGAQSFALGYNHSLYDNYSLMVGSNNYTSTSTTAQNNLFVGNSNSGTSNVNSLFVGNNNSGTSNQSSTALGAYSSVTSSINSFITGSANTVNSLSAGLVAGSTNVANGTQFVMGIGLIAQDTTQAAVVLGQYNKTIPPVAGSPKPVLVVGIGTSSATANRANALEVYTDGKVTLPKRQGDLGMGRFGNSIDQ